MDREWGRDRAHELLALASSWLEAELRDGHWHTMPARKLCGLSLLASHKRGLAISERVLRDAPDEAFSAAMITNIDRKRFVRREPPTTDEIDRDFPVYGPSVLEHVQRFSDAHVRRVLEGQLDEAWAHASSDLYKEEHLATCALVGDFGRTVEMLVHLPPDRQAGPLMVACVESFLLDDLGTSRAVLDRLNALRPRDYWMWIHLTSGFLGRVPWGGYPFPDY